MTRKSGYWNCVICGREYPAIICGTCEDQEKQKQHNEPGSITDKQLGYIEHLIENIDTKTSGDIIYGATADQWTGSLEDLSTRQAGMVIQAILRNREENPPKCIKCGTGKQEVMEFCRSCYDKVFYDGVPLVQCPAIKAGGEQCKRKGHFKAGYCDSHIHLLSPAPASGRENICYSSPSISNADTPK